MKRARTVINRPIKHSDHCSTAENGAGKKWDNIPNINLKGIEPGFEHVSWAL